MKNNGKKLGIGGTIVVVILYALLQWMGIISPDSEEMGSSGQATIENSVAYNDSQAAEAPVVTEKPVATEQPEITDAPTVTEKPKATEAPKATEKPKATATPAPTEAPEEIELTDYGFRNQKLQDSHFEKHGIEMGFETVEDYIEAANKVISNPDALHKLEAEDNDHIYFIEETNEFVVLSQDGYIRTYYIANGGIDYFNRQ